MLIFTATPGSAKELDMDKKLFELLKLKHFRQEDTQSLTIHRTFQNINILREELQCHPILVFTNVENHEEYKQKI